MLRYLTPLPALFDNCFKSRFRLFLFPAGLFFLITFLCTLNVSGQIIKSIGEEYRNNNAAKSGIKNITVFEKVNRKKSRIAIFEYDKEGYLTYSDTLIRTASGLYHKSRYVSYSADRKSVTDSIKNESENQVLVIKRQYTADGKLIKEFRKSLPFDTITRSFHYNAEGLCDSIFRLSNEKKEGEYAITWIKTDQYLEVNKRELITPALSTYYKYNAEGKIIFFKGMQHETTFIYDKKGRLEKQLVFLGNPIQYFENGNPYNAYQVNYTYKKQRNYKTITVSCNRKQHSDGAYVYKPVGDKRVEKYTYMKNGLMSGFGSNISFNYNYYN